MQRKESSVIMRLRKVKNALEIVKSSKWVINYKIDSKSSRGITSEKIFHNNNPLRIEIGMGKGNFIMGMAKENPDINFIGIEKYESIVCKAIKKLDEEPLPNVRILCLDALGLGDYLNKEVEVIYLNFSDPWPKKRHAKRRLTAKTFLPIYEEISKSDVIIIQKTDNVGLFEYSIMSLTQNGYVIDDISLDLANYEIPNVETEYEKKFKSMGIPIRYLKAIKYKKD